MPGKQCHACKNLTMYKTPTGGKCSQCGYTYNDNPGPGRGYECYECKTYTVKNGKCTKCGRTYGNG